MEGEPRGNSDLSLRGDGPHQDLRGVVAAEAESGAVNAQEARAAALEHLQTAAGANAQFGHPADPGRFSVNFGNISPFATTQQFQRQEKVRIHRVLSSSAVFPKPRWSY